MNKKNYIVAVLLGLFMFAGLSAEAQVDKLLGMWKTVDDETGQAKSHVKIFKATDGLYYGRVEKLLNKPADTKCTACTGKNKDKPIVGMLVVTKMKAKGKELVDGNILDPGNGKSYYCTISLDPTDPKKLIVRGSLDSWGIAGRSQTWIRLE